MSKSSLNFKSMKKRFVLILFLSAITAGTLSPAQSADKSSSTKDRATADSASSNKTLDLKSGSSGNTPDSIVKKVGGTDKKAGPLKELSLDDLMDTAILLRFISEQSINIYEEAARVPAGPNANANYKPPVAIPIVTKESKYLPARQEWLVFYLGIMEPVIRELAKEANEIEAGSKQMVIPKSMEETLTPLWDTWSANTKDMNRHLDELLPMFDDNPPDNIAIQNKAVEIYENVKELEKVRKELFSFLKNNIKSGDKEKILITPD